jgi:hypothetical protein
MRRRLHLLLPAFALALGVTLIIAPARSGPSAQQSQALVAAAAKAYPVYEAQHKVGRVPAETVYVWSVRWLEAQGGKKAGAGPAGEHVKRMAALEATVKSQVQAGMASAADAAAAEFYRIEAEVWAQEAGKP